MFNLNDFYSSKYRKKTSFCMKNIIALSFIISIFWFSKSAFAANESSIIKHTGTDEVIVKNSADCHGEFKSRFIKKLDGICRDGEIAKTRFERLKKELVKLRERTAERLEALNLRLENLIKEKNELNCILKDVDSIEIRFNKVKILADEKNSDTSSVSAVKEVNLNSVSSAEISVSAATREIKINHKKSGRNKNKKK